MMKGRGDPIPLSISLQEDLKLDVTVPLAAILLDYPIAYVPIVTEGSLSAVFLSGVPVSTYECILTNSRWDADKVPPASQHGFPEGTVSVMKFSCPKVLEGSSGCRLSPEVISNGLKCLFEERLKEIGLDYWEVIIVSQSVTFDRLAL